MVAASETVWNAVILFIFFKGFKSLTELEVFDAFMELFGIQLTETSSEIAFRKLRVDINWLVEIVNSQLMIAHVLINNSSSDKNCFIVWNLLQNLTKALERLLELISFMIHQSQMESTTDEVFLQV